ncbi:hypothetical protein DL93DRAFT_2089639 [Clavulina sp. PMI_390]|nr:hypothetical protein DL93DRAFT_2089639 [Clavulina sp. PMI_390]
MPVPIFSRPSPLAATIVSSKLAAPSLPAPQTQLELVARVVSIIENYLLTTGDDDQFDHSGRKLLSSQVKWHINKNLPLELVLPAFPFKSPSLKKVLGVLPDLGEEIFLRRLEDICRSIEDVYSPGAYLSIVSDGIVYGELLRVPDDQVYRYNAALRSLIKELGLSHVRFTRIRDLLNGGPGACKNEEHDISEAQYVDETPFTREAFLSTDIGAYDVDGHLKADAGVMRTYQGYKKFLELDLERSSSRSPSPTDSHDVETVGRRGWKKNIGLVAKKMLANGAKFSALVQRAFPTGIRLSIHRHTNAGPKFALRIFPALEKTRTPWHNVVVLRRDGSLAVEHNQDVDLTTHELIYRYDRPYYYREVDPAMQDWEDYIGGTPSFEPLHPFGLLVRAPSSEDGSKPSWANVPMDKVRELVKGQSLVIFRGFGGVNKEKYVAKANEMGKVTPWFFGDVLEVKDDPSTDLNNALTREAMSMHFDDKGGR